MAQKMTSIYFVFLALSLTHISTGTNYINAPCKVASRKPKPKTIENCEKFFKGRMEQSRELNKLLITWFQNRKYKRSAWRTPTKMVFDCKLVESAVELLQDKAWLGPSWKARELRHPHYFFDASADFISTAMLVFATLESLKSNACFIFTDLQFGCAYANNSQTGVCSLG